MHLVVGLGNPGARYRGTRHNLGFQVADELARRHGIELGLKRFKALYGKGSIAHSSVLLSKPQTYMNRSGQSVGVMAGWHKVPADRVIVIHDDLDLDLGRVKLKVGGGHGGHNGIRDVRAALGDPGFARVRIGIGRPDGPEDPAEWVLHKFRPDEQDAARASVDRASDAVEAILAEGIEAAMNRFNTKGEGNAERG